MPDGRLEPFSLPLRSEGVTNAANAASFLDGASDARQRRKPKKIGSWRTEGPVYLYPHNRYCFWTPSGLRGRGIPDSQDPLDRFLVRLRSREALDGNEVDA